MGFLTINQTMGHLIIGKIDFTQPSSAPVLNDNWSLGVPHTITWTTTGEINNVNIYYSDTGLFGAATLINSEITSGECNPGPACDNNPNADTSFFLVAADECSCFE